MLDEILEKSPRFPSLLSILGQVHLDHDDIDRAQALFDKALQQDPDLASAYEGISSIYLRQGENEKAAEAAVAVAAQAVLSPGALGYLARE